MSKERITVTIPNVLKTLAQPGDFVASGAAEIPLLRLAVDGVGLLGLPMNEPQVQALRAVATDAPYGRGKDTLIDPHVRSCKQIHASHVHTEDPKYLAILSEIVSCCAERLGVDGGVEAELYKMLIYTEGDFFLEHRDTEKAPRMFATLVVVLPSEHTGGELIVRHGAREERPTLSGVELDLLRWAAFYADCKHELLPLRSGHRVALVYNLLRTHGPTLNAPDNSSVVDSLAIVLNTWGKKSGEPEKIIVPLEHKYTLAELSFAALKNRDAAVARSLVAAAQLSDCSAYLALMSITERGTADMDAASSRTNYYRRRGRTLTAPPAAATVYQHPQYDVMDMDTRECAVSHLRRIDGGVSDWAEMTVDLDCEIAPPMVLERVVPDEDKVEEATGNEGATYERTYRWAAIVLWPNVHGVSVILHAGGLAAVTELERFAAQNDLAQVRELVKRMSDDWQTLRQSIQPLHDAHKRVLSVLIALNEKASIQLFLQAIMTIGGLGPEDLDAIANAITLLPPAKAGVIVHGFVQPVREGRRSFAVRAQLMLLVAKSAAGTHLQAAFDAMVRLLADEPPIENFRYWHHPSPEQDEQRAKSIAALFNIAVSFRKPAHDSLLHTVLAHPERFELDSAVLGAVLRLSAQTDQRAFRAARPLCDAVITHLKRRIAEPLAPPSNAVRSSEGISCKCEYCAKLIEFLRDPVLMLWTLRAAKANREHVEHAIKGANSDISTQTMEDGNPHGLACRKTTASFTARASQRAADEQNLERLIELLGS